MDKVKIYISSSTIPLTEVKPIISGAFEWKREGGKVYYKHESKDKFKFSRKTDYSLLMQMEGNECGEITVLVQRLCNGLYVDYWDGVFSLFDATINKDLCWLEVKPKPMDNYKCFEDALKEVQNIYSSGSQVTVTALAGTYEDQTCFNFEFDADCNTYYNMLNTPDDTCLANPAEWCLKENIVLLNGQQGIYNCYAPSNEIEQQTTWHREIFTTNCVNGSPVFPIFGTGWQLLTDDCSGSGTATFWRCPAGGTIVGDYTHGRTLIGVMQKMLNNMGCGLTIKSDFFGLNPVGDAPTNAAYAYALANLQNLTVHQKSDIKRKNASNPSGSTAWELQAKDWFEDFQKIFNVWYTIEDGVLIWEHYSYFTTNVGWDLSNAPMVKQYDFSGNENIGTERFYWADESSSYAFKAQPITYDCGSEEKEQRCRLISTDLAYIENELYADKISDEGFVLIANADALGTLVIIDANAPLKWTNLQANLHQHARLYKSGKINNVQQNFISWLPYRKQEKFKTDYCCGATFEPRDLITTSLGNGVVSGASHNLYTGKLELELNY